MVSLVPWYAIVNSRLGEACRSFSTLRLSTLTLSLAIEGADNLLDSRFHFPTVSRLQRF